MYLDRGDIALKLKSLFDTAVDGIIIINASGEILEANSAACSLFGYKLEELVGEKLNSLMPSHEARRHDGYVNNYLQTGQKKIIGKGREVYGKKKDNTLFPFWLSVVEVKLKKEIIFAGFIHDLSDIKNAEIRLKNLNAELESKVVERTYELENVVNQLLSLNHQLESEIFDKNTAQEALKQREIELQNSLDKERELNILKTRFVSMASHEFRTPLSTILSSVSLIGRYVEADQQPQREKHIQKIKTSVAHLVGILNDFLSLSKLDEGKISVNKEEFDMEVLFDEVIEEISILCKPGQKIHFESAVDNPLISSDRKFLKNTLFNLLSNAVKYSSENDTIECFLEIKGHSLVFSVKDYGKGIPEEDQKHLFSRFFRASNVTNIEGTGLGLNIVKRYLDLIDGDISFESELNKGTKFVVTMTL
jgi:PAS domain S-box-containing protein